MEKQMEKEGEKAEVVETKKQQVKFFGDDIVFQFSITGNGSRTRKAKVENIREATEEEIEDIREMVRAREKCRRGKRTAKRMCPVPMADAWKIYVGDSAFRFKAEDKRKVKVWANKFKDYPIRKWESYEAIFEDEDKEDEE